MIVNNDFLKMMVDGLPARDIGPWRWQAGLPAGAVCPVRWQAGAAG